MRPRGRPTSDAAAERRRRVRRFVAELLFGLDVVKRVTDAVGASEATVRRDLARLVRDLDSSEMDSATACLMAELEAAKTPEAFARIQQHVLVALASHRMDLDEARFLFDSCKEIQRCLSPAPASDGATKQQDGTLKANASDPFDLGRFIGDLSEIDI